MNPITEVASAVWPPSSLGTIAICLSAMIGLSTLLLPEANAQISCDTSIICGVSLNPQTGSQVVPSQIVTVNYVRAGITAGSCYVTNGGAWLAYPDGNVSQTELDYVLNTAPAQFFADGTAGGGGAPCVVFSTSYMVNANDIGRTLQLGSSTVIPRKYAQNGNRQSIFPGTPHQIHFFVASEGDGYSDANFTFLSGFAYSESQVFLTVVNPGLTITNVYDTNCYIYSAPITFHGSVCNTGSVTLVNLTVSNTPAATITFASTTSSGRPFDPSTGLTNGESVDYTGSYQPTGNLWGSFTNTVVASGIANAVFLVPTYFATSTTTGVVCPPSISAALSGEKFFLSFPTQTNHTYTVQYTDALAPPNWQLLTSHLGDGTIATIPMGTTNTQRFFRVLIH